MRKLLFILTLLTLTVALSASSYAQVSSAAVLFLRIAAGARAAGMGEAFVAVADDATTTHWNPAGLGTYPLASKWFEVKIPDEYRPLKDAILMKGDGSADDYTRYDLWAITPDGGLVEFSQDKWLRGDVYEGPRDRTLDVIIRDYTGLVAEEDAAKVDSLVKIVADRNNQISRDSLNEFADEVISAIPEDYDQREEMENSFVALKRSYDLCRINLDRYNDARENFKKSYKDSTLSAPEIDRILFAVEKASSRFNMEEIQLPFEICFTGQINDIAAEGNYLYVGTENGLFRYIVKSKKWQRYTSAEGLPANRVDHISLNKRTAFLGTDKGVVIFDLGKFGLQSLAQGIPNKPVEAIVAGGSYSAWAVIEGDLYNYDGKLWKNYYVYRDVLDSPLSQTYTNMSITGTEAERKVFEEKFESINSKESNLFDIDSPEVQGQIIDLVDSIGMASAVGILKDSLSKMETGQVFIVSSAEDLTNLADSIGIIEAFKLAKKEAAEKAALDSIKAPGATGEEVGEIIKVPYTVGFPYKITAMNVDNEDNLWVGTDYGALEFDGRRWHHFGYRDYVVEQSATVQELADELEDGNANRAQQLAENIIAVNKFETNTLDSGQVIKLYANPAGAKINAITVSPHRVYFATDAGAITYEMKSEKWSRFGEKGLGHEPSYAMENIDGGYWFLTDERSKFKGGARSELALMHVNWLPELADDIYYEFLSYVQNVQGWGTVGGNITFLSYGSITRTDETGNIIDEFSAYDVSLTLSYGTPLTNSLSGGISAKVIYSRLSPQGAGQEQGSGTSTGIAFDLGLLYKLGTRFTIGMAVTNLGPDISYIDVAQSDALPRNLALGFGWKLIDSKYNKFLVTMEANKSLVGVDLKHPSLELKEVILNGGFEYWYGNFIALRSGYVYDQEGDIKTPTLGFGLAYRLFKFDFAYIPSSDNVPLANTMRLSLGINFD